MLAPGGAVTHGDFQLATALSHQVITDMPQPFDGGVRLHQLDRALGNCLLIAGAARRDLRALADALHRVAVPVAGRKVHQGVYARGVGAQYPLYQAAALDESRPLDEGQRAHAGNDVADRHAIRRAPQMLGVDDVFYGFVAGMQIRFDPPDGRQQRGVGVPQELQELHPKDRFKPETIAGGHCGPQAGAKRVMCRLRLCPQELRPDLGRLMFLQGEQRLRHQPPQVLDQSQTQHNGDRPQLAEGERANSLIAAREAGDHVGVQMAVCVRDQLERNAVDARIACTVPVRHLGQLMVVAVREVLLDETQLLLHDVEIIEQPFGGGG